MLTSRERTRVRFSLTRLRASSAWEPANTSTASASPEAPRTRVERTADEHACNPLLEDARRLQAGLTHLDAGADPVVFAVTGRGPGPSARGIWTQPPVST